MKISRAIILWIFLIFSANLFFSSLCLADQGKKYSSVKEFLADQSIVRVDGYSSSGFGGLATTMRVMERLRKLGFHGEYEFIYPEQSAHDVMTLFGMSQEELDRGKKNSIHFIKLKDFLSNAQQGSVRKVPLGITGPADYSLCQFPEAGTNEDVLDTLFCKSLAYSLNTDVFVVVSNEQGAKAANYYYFNQEKEYYLDDALNTYILSDPVTLADVSRYLTADPAGMALAEREPNIKVLMDGIITKSFYVMPVYGWTLHNYWDISESGYLRNILQVIMGARYAQIYGSPEMRSKGLVIPVFYNYETESKKILELLRNDNWGSVDFPHADMAKYGIKILNLAAVFSTANLSDPDLVQKLEKLQPGHILLLSMGPLPKLVFDGLYTLSGQDHWPQVREGLDSLSQLILTGKPHLHCGFNWELPIDPVAFPMFSQELKYLDDNFCSTFNYRTPDFAFVTIGNLIIDSQNSSSEFSRYFESVKADALKLENDKVNRAMEVVVRVLDGDKSSLKVVDQSN